MPRLPNRFQERFAQEYIKNNGDTYAAVLAAGYSPNNVKDTSARLSVDPAVRARIEELTQQAAAVAALDKSAVDTVEYAALVWRTMRDIVVGSSSDMARVQAGRVLGDFLLLGEAGARVAAARDKIDLERERIALQRAQVALLERSGIVQVALSYDIPGQPPQPGRSVRAPLPPEPEPQPPEPEPAP